MSHQKNSNNQYVPVVLPVAIKQAYSYEVPAGAEVEPGTIVRVPLGPREVIGAVWDSKTDTDIDPKKIKTIQHIYPTPPINAEMRRFIEWVANWTLAELGMVLRMVLRVPNALEPPIPIKGVRFTGVLPDKMTPARTRVLEIVNEGLSFTKSDLSNLAGVTTSVINGLVRQDVLEIVDLPQLVESTKLDLNVTGPKLSTEQKVVADRLVKAVSSGYSVTLLDGVTGSGKTEVFFEAVAETIKLGKQALILVPEISLTTQYLDRFEKRFNLRPLEWHSNVSAKKREHAWRQIANNNGAVVVGARSALFLPFTKLGLIVVDEEHDTSFKQAEMVPYSARDMSVVRGQIGNFPVVLSSATPSIESRVNADQKRYNHSVLPNRVSGTELPEIQTIDMRAEGPARGHWLAPKLIDRISESLANKTQSLLFLNRRGYAPLTLCRKCGFRYQCKDCSTWLVEHRFRQLLICHHCGYQLQVPIHCDNCGVSGSLVACGPGIERVAEEVAEIFPDARTLMLSSDLGGGIEQLRREIKQIENGEVDIVIGTQIVAKGMNFPKMMLVGVVDADLGLSYGDLRAAEKTFQLLAQVTGRAGRIQGKGIGMIQSYLPEHPVISAMVTGESEAFYQTEISIRENSNLPPFSRLAGIVISAPERSVAEDYARVVARSAPRSNSVSVLGPVEAPLAMIRGQYRFRLLVQVSKVFDLQSYIRQWTNTLPKTTGGLKIQIDIDPISFV